MRTRQSRITSIVGLAALGFAVFLCLLTAPHARAQQPSAPSPAIPQWQVNAGSKRSFEVASVRQNSSGERIHTNFSLGPGDDYSPNGGLFNAVNVPAEALIFFAYKLTANELQTLHAELPKWVSADRFDVQARAEGNPTKDQMRLMVQSLLADRFKLAAHRETRELPVFELVLIKPGQLGPKLWPFPDGSPCQTPVPANPNAPQTPQIVPGGFPGICGGVMGIPASAPGRINGGGRDVTMDLIANSLAGSGGLNRPIINRTGLPGTYDFSLEFVPQINGPNPSDTTAQADQTGPTILEALREQLGLRLEPQTGPVDVLVIDYIEEPSPN